MKCRANGFGGLQLVLTVATMAIVSVVAVPQYEAYSNQARITETLDFAGGSVQEASHFFLEKGNFPRTHSEANALVKDQNLIPEFVREMTITPDETGDSVVIKVFFNGGVFENQFDVEQYVFLEGRKSPSNLYSIDWRCGTSGIELAFLPDHCFD